ncbi:MAG: protein kinase [Sandaracinaceae bacterium]|nr:protein kinase [Sandaracinaceae bacterium]
MSAIPFGNYELVERIAEGGMAEVWRARSLGVAGFEKTVVIKRVLPMLLERPGFAELLVREAKIAARLSHPNVIQIYDLGEQDGSYFIAMEFLRGRDLAAALSHRSTGDSPLDLGLRLWLASEVAKALDYAHRARFDDGKAMSIVHRDVSPQNVLLGYEGEVKVADFGIARADEPGLGRGEDPKILRGKYAYMSPEQARGEPLDKRSDIFSFGVLLFELATRRRMFRGMTSAQTLEMVRAAKLPSYRRHLPMPELEPILARALAPARGDRFASAAEIHAELLGLVFALGRPVGATDLAAAMHAMFPTDDPLDPNKLRVDLMERAYDDATAASDPGRDPSAAPTLDATARTRAMPTSRKIRSETRRLAFLVARLRSGEDRLFSDAVARAGGDVLTSVAGLRVAAFGAAGVERAVGHAVRGALELRRSSRIEGPERLDPTPAMGVVAGEGKVLEGVILESSPEVAARAGELLRDAPPDALRVAPELEAELGRDFRYELRDGELSVLGFRSRKDRDAGAMRQGAPLVGRRDLLRRLSALLIEAAQGRGALVHLIGEPGVGKSRLLAELRAAAAPRDFVFVHGRADETDAERAFGAFGDLVFDLCGIEPEDGPEVRFEKVERMRVLGLRPRELRLLGELIGLAYPVATGVRAGRPRGLELALALRKALLALSRDRVVVLAFEDLQWMDDATRQVLPLLVDGLVPGRVVVLVTRRHGAAGPLPSGGRTLPIQPLDRDAVGRLVAHHLGARAVEPALAERVLELTGGIPGWIELLGDALGAAVSIDGGLAHLEAAMPDVPVPTPLRSSVAARVERLRARERSILRVVAALGGTVDVRLICSIEGLIGGTERAPLRRLWIRRLIVGADGAMTPPERIGPWGGHREEGGLPSEVRVPGELLRRAILAELDAGELARLHARIVATLERVGAHENLAGLEKLAHHAALSVDPRRAPDYHARAAQLALELGDRPRASHHYAEAARLQRRHSGDAADASAFDLGLEAADAALDAGVGELAEIALAALEVGEPRADATQRVHFAILRARHARQRLDGAAALAALDAVAQLFDEVPAALRDEARTLQARTCVEQGATARALEVIDTLLETAEGARQGTALALRATALARLDDLDAAEEAVNAALALAARLGEASLRYASLAALAGLVEARGDAAAAAARYREAAEVAQGVADPDDLASLHASAAVCALAVDDLDEATKRTDDAGRWADRSSAETWRLVVAALRGALAIREHPDATYVPGLVRAVERLEELGRSPEAAVAVEMLVHGHLALGDEAAAGRTLERAARHAERAGHSSYARRLRERRDGLSAP